MGDLCNVAGLPPHCKCATIVCESLSTHLSLTLLICIVLHTLTNHSHNDVTIQMCDGISHSTNHRLTLFVTI